MVRVAFLLIYPKKQIKRENFNFVTGCLTYKMFGPKNYQLQQREACKYELNYFTVNSIGSFYLFSYGISELLWKCSYLLTWSKETKAINLKNRKRKKLENRFQSFSMILAGCTIRSDISSNISFCTWKRQP